VDDTVLISAASEVIINAVAIPDTITLTPDPAQMLTRSSLSMTVSLNGPAPVGGQVIDLQARNTNVVSTPLLATIAEGETTVDFIVDANALVGSTIIDATASGFSSDNTRLTTNARAYSLLIPLVGINRSVTGTLTLAKPAPSGGA